MNYKTFPERDMTKTAEQQGIFRKFEVSRVDGSDQAGGKHHGCRYFVLDLDHDQHAPAAMRAYAVACASTHPDLSADIEREFGAEASADKGAVPNPHDAAEQADIGKRIRRVAKLAGYVPDGSDEFYYAAAFAILGRAADALETRAAMPGKVAEGWKLVPVEPTPEMVNTLADAISSMSATDAYKETIKAATINPVQGEPVLIAYAATDLDGHVGVGLTIADAQARAGHGCDTIIPLYDIATPGNETAFAAAPAVQGQDG